MTGTFSTVTSFSCRFHANEKALRPILHVYQMQEYRNNAIDTTGRKNVLQNSSYMHLKDYTSQAFELCRAKIISIQ